MTASSDDTSFASRSDRRKFASTRNSYYMIAPSGLGVTRQTLIDRLNRVADVEVVQTYAERGTISPPIAVVRTSDENAAALRRSTGGALIIEPDRYLRAASFMGSSFMGSSPPSPAIAAMNALGPGFAVTIQVLTESGQPVEHAAVQLVGEQGAVQGLTDKDGKVDLTLYGELPDTVTELFVKPRSGYWGLWRHRPNLQADAVNTFTLESLSLPNALDWGGKAMRFDQLPTECRGTGIKIALIDSGIAISHKQLARIDHGIDIRGGGEGRSWSQDVFGHGTRELDVSAPGVAIITFQSPDGYAICSGSSLAAAHVTALAALILAHHSDFKGSFARRDFQRVERLFQILKETAQPIGHPWQTGAGLPDAARALGVWSGRRPLAAPLDAGLGEMRNAIRT
jgi:hypothetical protein